MFMYHTSPVNVMELHGKVTVMIDDYCGANGSDDKMIMVVLMVVMTR